MQTCVVFVKLTALLNSVKEIWLSFGSLKVNSPKETLFMVLSINVNNLTQATTTYSVSFNWHGIPCAFFIHNQC